MSEAYYKLLSADGITPMGYGRWSLPDGNQPGVWLNPAEGALIACANGYHILTWDQVLALTWRGEHLYEVETAGKVLDAGDKCVCRRARTIRHIETWNERNLRLFACDCAERVLHVVQAAMPADRRPRLAIETARRFANGEATRTELDAARTAARNAAGAAAGAAAGNAAGNAAGDAAWDAAWDAAGNAAWDAAWDAAGNAAGDAAWGAERQWQRGRLAAYLTGGITS